MKHYSPAGIAEIIGVTVVTLCHWRGRNVGPDWFKHGGVIYYRADALKAYVERVGTIPANMTGREKQTFFTAAHKVPGQVKAPAKPPVKVRKAPKPPKAPAEAIEPVTLERLTIRMAVVERALDELRMRSNPPKRTPRKRRTRVNGVTIPRGARRVPTPDAIPY